MRVRLQQLDVTKVAKYEKDIGTVFVFDDKDQVIFVVVADSGGYRFAHRGQPEFNKVVKEFLNWDLPTEQLVEIEP